MVFTGCLVSEHTRDSHEVTIKLILLAGFVRKYSCNRIALGGNSIASTVTHRWEVYLPWRFAASRHIAKLRRHATRLGRKGTVFPHFFLDKQGKAMSCHTLRATFQKLRRLAGI